MPEGIRQNNIVGYNRPLRQIGQRLSAAEEYAFFDSLLQFAETVEANVSQDENTEKVKPSFA